jgi:haloacetate dehalogenase
LVLWGVRGGVGRLYGKEVLRVWGTAANEVSGSAVDSGHYLAEEAPIIVAEAFESFFT